MKSYQERRRSSLLKVEKLLLELSRVSPKDIETGDLLVTKTEHIHYHVISKVKPDYSREKNNVLLLLHGFGGCGAMYYRLISDLADNFYMIIIDLPGFGFSSRPDSLPFNCTQSCVDFYVERLEVFVEKMGMNYFSVVGHSLGAFLSAHFFSRHHEKIKHLFLLSPAGMSHPTENQQERLRDFFKDQFLPVKYVINRVIHKIFGEKESPFSLLRWPLKSLYIRFYLKNKRSNFSEAEKQKLSRLIAYFLEQTQSGEKVLGYLFHYGPMSFLPITQILAERKELAKKVSVIWGEFDVMDKDESTERLKALGLQDVKVTVARNAEHQLPFQAIDHICEEIAEVLKSDDKK